MKNWKDIEYLNLEGFSADSDSPGSIDPELLVQNPKPQTISQIQVSRCGGYLLVLNKLGQIEAYHLESRQSSSKLLLAAGVSFELESIDHDAYTFCELLPSGLSRNSTILVATDRLCRRSSVIVFEFDRQALSISKKLSIPLESGRYGSFLKSLCPIDCSHLSFAIGSEFETKISDTFVIKFDSNSDSPEVYNPELLSTKSSTDGSWIYSWFQPTRVDLESAKHSQSEPNHSLINSQRFLLTATEKGLIVIVKFSAKI